MFKAIRQSFGKAFTMVFSTRPTHVGASLPGTRFNYAARVDGRRNSIVMAVVNWFGRTFPEAPTVVQAPDGAGNMVQDPRHEMARLVRRPNPFYSGALMKTALITDYLITGNAFELKARNTVGLPVELWWAPANLIRPVASSEPGVFISHYEYSPHGIPLKVPVEDVIHHRWGLDPKNPRLGLGPLGSLIREIFTDDEAANFTAALLRNFAAPGVLVSPKDGGGADADDLKEAKLLWNQTFGGDSRGGVMFMTEPTEVKRVSLSPKEMDLKMLRRIPEERISAIFGLAAVVAGLGAGLDRSTFANFKEAREAAYESALIPIQRLFAEDLSTQLLPEFDPNPDAEVTFDYRNVRVLQEDQNKRAELHNILVHGSIEKRSEARAALGLSVEDGDDVYLIPLAMMETGPEADPITRVGGRTLAPADAEGDPITDADLEKRMGDNLQERADLVAEQVKRAASQNGSAAGLLLDVEA